MTTGQLTIFSRHVRTGKRQVLVRTKNLILNQMYQQFVALMGGGTTSYINRMQFGTGTSSPTVDQTQLQRAITPVKTIDSATVNDTIVTFRAYLLQNEGNGFPISEAALMTADGLIVARTTFAARTKTTDYQFGFEWAVNVKAV